MVRILSRTLLRHSTFYNSLTLSKSPPTAISSSSSLSLYHHRQRSSKAQIIEIDLDSSSSSSSDCDEETEQQLRKLEDIVQSIVVRKSTPDWLPFLPGSSFWVPPRRRQPSVADLVDKLTNQLSEEESLSLTSARGWPCSSFFIDDGASPHPAKVSVEVKVQVLSDPEYMSRPVDEEG